MESNSNNFVENNKKFVVFFLIWFIIHLTFLLINWSTGDTREFWPFGQYSKFEDYDLTEFIFYNAVLIIIWAIKKISAKDMKILKLTIQEMKKNR